MGMSVNPEVVYGDNLFFRSDRYILILLGKQTQETDWQPVVALLASFGLRLISERVLSPILNNDAAECSITGICAVELMFQGEPANLPDLHKELIRFSKHTAIDLSFQHEPAFRKQKRLACFDMDSTLIKTEVIDELAEYAGVGPFVRQVTERAMSGEIDFKESFRERLKLLKGVDECVLKEISARIPLMDGIGQLMSVLKRQGCKIAVISGGFTYFALQLKERFGLDYAFANSMEIVSGKLTGNYLGEIMDSSRKVRLLRELARKEGLDLSETLAVGDGANDIPMLQTAGLGIAFHAKPRVREQILNTINNTGLEGILCYLGLSSPI